MPATLFDQQELPAQVTELDRARAKRLREYVGARCWFASRSPKRWAPAFAILRRRLGEAEPRIDAALDFIIATRLARPKVCDGRQLINCWNWVESLMERARDDPRHAVVSEEAKRVAKSVGNLDWPGNCKAELALAAQRTHDNAKEFREKVKQLIEDRIEVAKAMSKSGKRTYAPNVDVLEHVARKIGNPWWFAECWLRRVAEKIRHFDPPFSGSLTKSLAWRPSLDFDMGTRYWRQAVNDRCGKPFIWDEIVKEVLS